MRVYKTNLDKADEDVEIKNQMMIIKKSKFNTVRDGNSRSWLVNNQSTVGQRPLTDWPVILTG